MFTFHSTSALFVTEEMKGQYKMMHQKKKLKAGNGDDRKKEGIEPKGLVTLKK